MINIFIDYFFKKICKGPKLKPFYNKKKKKTLKKYQNLAGNICMYL